MIELDGDQRREMVNSAQRFAAWRDASARVRAFRGSLSWHGSKGEDYLVRSHYDAAGIRRQSSLGRRSPETERAKAEWEAGRLAAVERERQLRAAVGRQAAVNRALGLGRVPLIGARILRALDAAGLLGRGLRVLGTNAVYVYEAAAGVMVEPAVTATLDVDLLMDARRSLRIAAEPDLAEGSLIGLLRRVDRSFARTRQTFRAANGDGYLVDLVKPERNPPWTPEREAIGAGADELAAVSIAGLAWHESAPTFEAVAIDERGAPLWIAATDPRVFAAHKLWLSCRPDREPLKRRRDEKQARVVARLVARYLTHLPYEAEALRMMPRAVFEAAEPLFAAGAGDDPHL